MALLTLISIACDSNGEVNFSFSFYWIILLLAVIGIIYHRLSGRPQTNFKIEEIEIPVAGAKVKFKRTKEVASIAHRAWVELITRKAALAFDEENDVIVEVYNSWFELFKKIRDLISSIPPDEINDDKDAKKLLEQLIIILNGVMRPHLTKWQAKFRFWFEHEKIKKSKLTPQMIQKRYPKYKLLVTDLKRINGELQEFVSGLKELSDGKTVKK